MKVRKRKASADGEGPSRKRRLEAKDETPNDPSVEAQSGQ